MKGTAWTINIGRNSSYRADDNIHGGAEMDTNAQGSKEVTEVKETQITATTVEKKFQTAVADENEDWVKKYKEQNHGEEPSFF